jgi:hypothetical protein
MNAAYLRGDIPVVRLWKCRSAAVNAHIASYTNQNGYTICNKQITVSNWSNREKLNMYRKADQ